MKFRCAQVLTLQLILVALSIVAPAQGGFRGPTSPIGTRSGSQLPVVPKTIAPNPVSRPGVICGIPITPPRPTTLIHPVPPRYPGILIHPTPSRLPGAGILDHPVPSRRPGAGRLDHPITPQSSVILTAEKPRGMQNPITGQAVSDGNKFHQEFYEWVKSQPGWKANPTLRDPLTGRIVRPDALTPDGRPVELKPNTPSGMRRGQIQTLAQERAAGKKGVVIFYDPPRRPR